VGGVSPHFLLLLLRSQVEQKQPTRAIKFFLSLVREASLLLLLVLQIYLLLAVAVQLVFLLALVQMVVVVLAGCWSCHRCISKQGLLPLLLVLAVLQQMPTLIMVLLQESEIIMLSAVAVAVAVSVLVGIQTD
jgi:hypothetical protein